MSSTKRPSQGQLARACWQHCERIDGFRSLSASEQMEVYRAMWELAENITLASNGKQV